MKVNVNIKITLCKVAILYTDNSTKIDDIEISGKYTIKNAKKFLKEKYTNDDIKNFEVLSVETNIKSFSIDSDLLLEFCINNSN